MGKVQVSHRLDSELLAWATEYGESRKSSRAVVIEEALRHFRGLTRGGVPDLPSESVTRPVVDRQAPDLMGGRQARLNAMIDKARGSR